jgi:hypothetical protein
LNYINAYDLVNLNFNQLQNLEQNEMVNLAFDPRKTILLSAEEATALRNKLGFSGLQNLDANSFDIKMKEIQAIRAKFSADVMKNQNDY